MGIPLLSLIGVELGVEEEKFSLSDPYAQILLHLLETELGMEEN